MEMLEAFTGYETGNKYDIFGFVPGTTCLAFAPSSRARCCTCLLPASREGHRGVVGRSSARIGPMMTLVTCDV